MAMRNCKKCDIEHWCENKDKPLCVMELEPGDTITFFDPNGGVLEEHHTVMEVNERQNITFGEKQNDGSYKETWGINGIFITDIRKENNTDNPVDHATVKTAQIKRILMEEFPKEATDEKAELVANRLYDQIMYENKDI